MNQKVKRFPLPPLEPLGPVSATIQSIAPCCVRHAAMHDGHAGTWQHVRRGGMTKGSDENDCCSGAADVARAYGRTPTASAHEGHF